MKIIVSSKYLASELNKLLADENERVDQVDICSNELIIYTQYKSAILSLVDTNGTGNFKQGDRRWDWIKELVNQVDEQPIVLDIYENVVNVIFQY
jgi:predicted GTPase